MADDSPPDSIDQSKEKKKNRRPANTAFRQQRLKAWQPILTPKTVIPLFFAIGIICAPIGGLLIYASSTVKYFEIDYTRCYDQAPTDDIGPIAADNIKTSLENAKKPTATWQRFDNITYTYNNYNVTGLKRCTVNFTLSDAMDPPILFYYTLENFYQNHRRYVTSFFDKQLAGDIVSYDDVVNSACTDPLKVQSSTKAYYPCGLIANSMFNDTFENPILLNAPTNSQSRATGEEEYVLDSTGIAWDADKTLYKTTKMTNFDNVVPPPYWQARWPNGTYSQEHPPPDIGNDEHFMVWMRTAGLPTFSKLYGRNSTEGLVAATYQLNIIDNFRTDIYQGKKSFVFTQLSVMGGHNNFLGILWLVVGGLCIVLAVVFLVTNFIKPRKLGDHTYLSWNNAPSSAAAKGKNKASGPATAMSTGRDLS